MSGAKSRSRSPIDAAHANEGALLIARDKREHSLTEPRERMQEKTPQFGRSVAKRESRRACGLGRADDCVIDKQKRCRSRVRNARKRTARDRRRLCLRRGRIGEIRQCA